MDHSEAALETLPQEALAALFSVLPINEASNACLVCKKWATVGTSDEVWRRRVVALFPDQFSTRAQINELIRLAEQDLITCKALVPREGEPGPQVRILWREVFFLSLRVSEAVAVVNRANAKIAAASARKAKPKRGPRASKNILQTLFTRVDAIGTLSFSLVESNVLALIHWMEELIQTLDEIEAGEEEPEPAGIAAAKIFSSFKEDLLCHYFKLSLEVAVQMCRQVHRPLNESRVGSYCETLGTILGSAMWMSHVPALGQFASLVMGQMSRLISALTETDQLSAVTPLFDMLIEWSTNYGKRIVKTFKQPWSANRSFIRFLSVCLNASAKLTDPVIWEKRLIEIAKDAESRDRNQAEEDDQKELGELDSLISQFFLELKSDQPVWEFFKLAIFEFENHAPRGLEPWRIAVAELRMLALVGEACPVSLEKDMNWVVSKLFQPALQPHANQTWRRSMCMAVAQLVYDIGDDRVANHIPTLFSLIMPMLSDPSVAEYARSSTINLWSAIQNVNEDAEIPRPVAAIGQQFVQDVVHVVESRQGDWPAAALALGYSAAALGSVFLPFYDKCLSTIKDGLVSAESSGTKEDVLKLVEAASLIIKLPVSTEAARRELLELSQFLVGLINRGIITHKSRATLTVFANLSCALGETEEAKQLVSFSLPQLLSILNTPPAPVDPMGMENMDNFEHTFVDGNFIAVSRSDLQLRVDALDALHFHINGGWKNLWGPFWRPTQQAIENVIRNEFNAARLSQTCLVLCELLEVMFQEISRKDSLKSEAERARVAGLEAIAQESFDSAFDTLRQLVRVDSPDGPILETCAEVLHDIISVIPNGSIKFDIVKMMNFINDLSLVAIDSTTAARGEDGEDEEDDEADEEEGEDEEGPDGEQNATEDTNGEAEQEDDVDTDAEAGTAAPPNVATDDSSSVEREKKYELETEEFRNALVFLTRIIQMVSDFDVEILHKLNDLDDWRTDDILRDTCGAQYALCVAVILVEKISLDALGPNFNVYTSMMLDGCQSPSPLVAQAATCGLGTACNIATQAFEPILDDAIENLLAVWEYEEARSDEERWGCVLDNVASSCGKIAACFGQGTTLSTKKRSRLLQIFWNRIPFREDEDENDWAAKTTTRLLKSGDADFLKLLRSTELNMQKLRKLLDLPFLEQNEPLLLKQLLDASALAGFSQARQNWEKSQNH